MAVQSFCTCLAGYELAEEVSMAEIYNGFMGPPLMTCRYCSGKPTATGYVGSKNVGGVCEAVECRGKMQVETQLHPEFHPDPIRPYKLMGAGEAAGLWLHYLRCQSLIPKGCALELADGTLIVGTALPGRDSGP